MDNRVRELRYEKGMRQEDLAGKINVSQQTISRIENGMNSFIKSFSRISRLHIKIVRHESDGRVPYRGGEENTRGTGLLWSFRKAEQDQPGTDRQSHETAR